MPRLDVGTEALNICGVVDPICKDGLTWTQLNEDGKRYLHLKRRQEWMFRLFSFTCLRPIAYYRYGEASRYVSR